MRTDLQSRVEHGLLEAVPLAGWPDLHHELRDRMSRYGVPGCALAVIEDGSVVWAAGYGTTVLGGPPVTTATLFQVASISKVVNALGVLNLAEHGLIDLDADVNLQLRSWQLPRDDRWSDEPVTPRRLLSHTAGTSTSGFEGYRPGSVIPTVVEILDGAPVSASEAVRVVTRPGAEYHYSGGGTTILQVLVEDVTGLPYSAAMKELVLEPLGMTTSHFQHPIDRQRYTNAAHGHIDTGEELPGGANILPTLAAGGLWASVDDLVLLIKGIFAMRDGTSSPAVLSTGATGEMLTPVPNSPHGLGPEILGIGPARRFRHNGTNRGFCSQIEGLLSKDSGVVIATNGNGGNTLIGEVLRAIDEVHEWSIFDRKPIAVRELNPNQLARLAGHYDGPFSMTAEVGWDGRRLFRPTAYGKAFLIPVGEDRFLDSETGSTMLVEELAGGTVIKVLVEGNEILRYTKAL